MTLTSACEGWVAGSKCPLRERCAHWFNGDLRNQQLACYFAAQYDACKKMCPAFSPKDKQNQGKNNR